MHKKIITACMALVAFAAFAVMPAVASASPELGETSGGTFTRLATGAKIQGTNIGETLMTNASGTSTLLKCTTASMTGTLNKNSGTEIEGTIEKASFSGTGAGGACTGSFGSDATVTTGPFEGGNGLPYCLKAGGKLKSDEFQLRGNSCANASRSITFILHTTFGECKYNREAAVSGTFTTDTAGEDAILSTSGQEFIKESGNFTCPETGFLKMSFTLETDETSTPLYIK